jgi:hypothetical protein
VTLRKRFDVWWYFAKPSFAGLRNGWSPFIRCPNCELLKFSENIILNCGICGSCFDRSFKLYIEDNIKLTDDPDATLPSELH